MKRKYTEPAVMMENFKLSDYIASGCDSNVTQVNLTDPSTGCLPADLQALNSMPSNYFVESLSCKSTMTADTNSSGYCYYIYSNSIFTS